MKFNVEINVNFHKITLEQLNGIVEVLHEFATPEDVRIEYSSCPADLLEDGNVVVPQIPPPIGTTSVGS